MSSIVSLWEVERGDASVTRVEALDADGTPRTYYTIFSHGRDHGAVFADKVPALLIKLARGNEGSPARDAYEALLEASKDRV